MNKITILKSSIDLDKEINRFEGTSNSHILGIQEGMIQVKSNSLQITNEEMEAAAFESWNNQPIEFREISEYSDYRLGFESCWEYIKSKI